MHVPFSPRYSSTSWVFARHSCAFVGCAQPLTQALRRVLRAYMTVRLELTVALRSQNWFVLGLTSEKGQCKFLGMAEPEG